MATHKRISLPNCNLYLNGSGVNTSGLKVVKISFPNTRSFPIETNNRITMRTHSILRGLRSIKDMRRLTKTELKTIAKEVCKYIQKYGTELQKKRLRVY